MLEFVLYYIVLPLSLLPVFDFFFRLLMAVIFDIGGESND